MSDPIAANDTPGTSDWHTANDTRNVVQMGTDVDATISGDSLRPARPRSLAEDLRARTDAELADLLAQRPDLLHPVPADISALATRATSGPSTGRALDRLTVFELQLLHALASLDEPASIGAVTAGLLSVPHNAIAAAISRLHSMALLWGSEDDLHVIRPVREALGTYPAGLGPAMATSRPAVAMYAADPAELERVLSDAPEGARTALDKLVWGPPVGRLEGAERKVSVGSAKTPIEWLLAHSIVVPINADTVVLPREIALIRRGGALIRHPQPDPPEIDVTPRSAELVDRTAGQQALTFTRQIEDLLELWSAAPPAVLRSGGLSVRDLTRTAQTLDVDEDAAALLIEVSYAAGLLGADGEIDESWTPTPTYDLWREESVAERWAFIAAAWLLMTRTPALVSGRDDSGSRVNALARDLDRSLTPDARRSVLDELVHIGPGDSPSHASLVERLQWRRPRRSSDLWQLVIETTPTEAERLGVTGLGALSEHGRALLRTTSAGASAQEARAAHRMSGVPQGSPEVVVALETSLPPLVDHILLQADLTAIAPGPLEPELARELGLIADIESTGGATVYRFSDATIRRGLDAGRSPNDILTMLTLKSKTPVPQPLEYLVHDAARRHGSLRIGVATGYIRCDDPSVLNEIMADRRLNNLRFVRLADTVVAITNPVDNVLERLRESGFAPSVENSEGAVVVRRPKDRRTPPRPRPPRLSVETPAASPELTSAAVRALRAGDNSTGSRTSDTPAPLGSGRLPRSSTTETIEALREALEASRSLWIGYADNSGTTTERVVEPIKLDSGFLTAYDLRTAEVRTFTVARITGVAPVATN